MSTQPTLRFSAIGLNHGHIYGQTNILLGAGADLRNLAGAQWFLIAGVVCIAVHFLFVILAARVFRVDVSMAAVASVASVGGAASAPVAAGYHREELVPVSIMLAPAGPQASAT